EPVVVSWQGNNIATISLPPVCAAANTGVPNYAPEASLQITDLDQCVAFYWFLVRVIPATDTFWTGLPTLPFTFCTTRRSHGPSPLTNFKSKLLGLFSPTCRSRRISRSQHSTDCQVSQLATLHFQQMIQLEASPSRQMPTYHLLLVCYSLIICHYFFCSAQL